LANGYYHYACLKITAQRCVTSTKHVGFCLIAGEFLNRWPTLRGDEVSGTNARPTSTKLSQMFDPLRKDPRFQKLCEEKKP
jgi:hypothetical protein